MSPMEFSEPWRETGGKPGVPKGTGGHLNKEFFHSTNIYGVLTGQWYWGCGREKATDFYLRWKSNSP